MSAKELVLNGAALCEMPNAGRYEKIAEDAWKEEGGNPNSVFARSKEDEGNEEGRLDPVFGWLWKAAAGKHSQKAFYIRGLANLVLLRHYVLEHGRADLSSRAAELEARLTLEEGLHPDVAAILPVSEAVKGFWT